MKGRVARWCMGESCCEGKEKSYYVRVIFGPCENDFGGSVLTKHLLSTTTEMTSLSSERSSDSKHYASATVS